MAKIGFTGTRLGMTEAQKETVRGIIRQATEFHHGDCVGADAEAVSLAQQSIGYICIVCHPPTDTRYRAFTNFTIAHPTKPYLARNKDIVNCSDILVAAPAESVEQQRSGTWSTVRYAQKKGKKVWIVFPDGEFKVV